jgi:ADP-heptose:LPS heptosyltransferase
VPTAVLAPPTDIPQLGALLSQCRLLVSGDTGPLHLAAASGCVTVGLFGPVPRERNGPRGVGHVNLQAPGAAWERRRVALGRMGDILPAQVTAAALQALVGGRAAAP